MLCPRCGGRLCHKCQQDAHCLVCGWYDMRVSDEARRVYEASLGRTHAVRVSGSGWHTASTERRWSEAV